MPDIRHQFQSAKTDSADSTRVQPSNWNEDHVITMAGGKVLGKTAGASGAVEELPLSFDATGQSVIPPMGTTAQRPVSALAGMFRYNTTTPGLELYTGGAWRPVSTGELAANLASLASLSLLADRGLYSTGPGTVATFPLTALARALLDDVDALTMRATIDAQQADGDLTAVAALSGVGIAVRTAANTWAQRLMTSSDGSVLIINNNGVLGNIDLTVPTSGVLAATAGAALGAIGTYSLLQRQTTGNITAGTTYAGSGFRYAGFASGSIFSDDTAADGNGSAPAGTWRAMGGTDGSGGRIATTLFLRIS